MAKLSSLRRDVARITAGEWLRLYIDMDPDKDVWVEAKGITQPFRDEVQRRIKELAQKYGGDLRNAPPEVTRNVDVDMYCDRLLTNVRGLDDDGRPVGFEEFCQLLRQEEFLELWQATQTAVQLFSGVKVEDAKAAAKN